MLTSLSVNASQQTSETAGTVISVGRKAILVACGDGSTLSITTLQFAGSKPVTAEQVCHGNQLNDGDQFGTDSNK